jgi:uncharacterized phage-associated protein
MPSAESVARYFLHLAALNEEPSPVTHMQLHKLLYYAQGWCLASRDRPLFAAKFQAWAHGPVEAALYSKFADYDGQPIARHEAAEVPSLSPEDRGIIESVWLGYGRYSAWQLREMTHKESPWREARGGLPEGASSRAPISDASIGAFFRKLHESQCRRRGIDPHRLAESVRQARAGETTELDLSDVSP